MVISALQITARSSQKKLHIAKLSKEKKKENETNCQTKKAKHPKQQHKIHNTIYIKHQKIEMYLYWWGEKLRILS